MCKEEEGLSIKWIFNRTNKFQFVELAKYRKLYKNNQQAGGLIMRLPAIFYACKCHFSMSVQMNPSLNSPRQNMVKLY